MNTQILTEQVLSLPLAERVALTEVLLQSLDERPQADSVREAIEQAARRDALLGSGEATGRSHDEVMRAARRAIGCD